MEQLNKNNFLLYAAKHYQNPHCTSITDFDKDCKRFIIARTLMRNYYKRGKVPMRLLMNHIIICTNLFGVRPAVNLFFYHCEEELHGMLVAIFDFLNMLPEEVITLPDPEVAKLLRET